MRYRIARFRVAQHPQQGPSSARHEAIGSKEGCPPLAPVAALPAIFRLHRATAVYKGLASLCASFRTVCDGSWRSAWSTLALANML